MNVYELYKLYTLESISQYRVFQWIMCIFIIYDSGGRERTKLFFPTIRISWTTIYFNNLTPIVYSYKWSHPPADKYIPKVISDQYKNLKLYINLVPCSLWNQNCIFSFNMLPAYIKHQIVNISVQGLLLRPKILWYGQNWQWVQNSIFA